MASGNNDDIQNLNAFLGGWSAAVARMAIPSDALTASLAVPANNHVHQNDMQQQFLSAYKDCTVIALHFAETMHRANTKTMRAQ